MLDLVHLNKTYTAKSIPVKDLSLSVGAGEFLTLLGPSGCGKSTTLRLIAGLETPTRGDVCLKGQPITHQRPGDRNMAMVFQSYALYPHLTVAENMASALKLRGIADWRQRVEVVAKTLGIADLLPRKPSQLSGGQRQRVALGRALVRRPDVFLLDEPLSNLDALLREHVRAELKQIFADQEAPVVYVTHDQTEAMTLSTQVAVLYDGELQQLAPPQVVYDQPANRFVAGFVGSPQMNLLELPCDRDHALLGSQPILLPRGVADRDRVVLGIRPEHIQLDPVGLGATLPGRVSLVENLGMQSLVTVHVEAFSLRLLLAADRDWGGDAISLFLPYERLHWFDAHTGARL